MSWVTRCFRPISNAKTRRALLVASVCTLWALSLHINPFPTASSRRQPAWSSAIPPVAIPPEISAEDAVRQVAAPDRGFAPRPPPPSSSSADAPASLKIHNYPRIMGLREYRKGSDVWFAGDRPETSFPAEQLATLREVFQYVQTPTATCRNLTRLGGVTQPSGSSDGDKLACLDRPLTLGQPDCLVYSIGINDEWSFDRAAARLGCQVHSFDPSMPEQKTDQVPSGVTFHRVGIGRNNHTNANGYPVLVLDHLMAQTGHTKNTIQYLKADAEGGEMDMLLDQLLDKKSMGRVFVMDRVEQLGLEIHFRPFPEREVVFYREMRDAFRQLKKLGFDLVASQPNQLVQHRYRFPGVPGTVSLLYEVLIVRKRASAPDFDSNVHYPCGSKLMCDLREALDGRNKGKAS